MGRILAIDYGRKRCGIAVTDPLKLIAHALETVPTAALDAYLADYFQREEVGRRHCDSAYRGTGADTGIDRSVSCTCIQGFGDSYHR